MGFWDEVEVVSNVEKKTAKSEALSEIEIQRRLVRGENVLRKGKPIESWFSSRGCRPKVTNISFLCTVSNSLGVPSEGPESLLDKIKTNINNGGLDKELSELQTKMDDRSKALRESNK
jgi:hypothetical protein